MSVTFVAIGRNEGERLKRCLRSLLQVSDTVVYVDSGSTDGSCEFARSLGVEVVVLDTSRGFTMSRARNAGWKRLLEIAPDARLVHFIDGDCELAGGWLETAREFIEGHPDIAVVCGRRRERHPDHSLYNRFFDIEWNTPVGEASASGGDALMRMEVLREAGGFNDALIAAEEPELCGRIRARGWKIWRLDHDMTWHDANMLHVQEWWKRHVRWGYGASDVACRTAAAGASGNDILFGDVARSAKRWTLGTVILLLMSAALAFLSSIFWIFPLMSAALLLFWILQSVRIGIIERKRAGGALLGIAYGFSLMLAKWPQSLGILKYTADRRAGRVAQLIEYRK